MSLVDHFLGLVVLKAWDIRVTNLSEDARRKTSDKHLSKKQRIDIKGNARQNCIPKDVIDIIRSFLLPQYDRFSLE